MSNELPSSVCCSAAVSQFPILDYFPPEEVRRKLEPYFDCMAMESCNSVAGCGAEAVV